MKPASEFDAPYVKNSMVYGIYDHSPERIYRHLDTCQMGTFIHVMLPWVECQEHGIKRIESEYGENGSDMTFAFESCIICLIQKCSMLVDPILRSINQ